MLEQTGLRPEIQAQLTQLVAQWSHGQATLGQIVGLNESEMYAIAQQGYHLFLQGKAEPARLLFEGLVALDPRNAYYYRALGAIFWRLKEPQRAIRQFTYAIRVSPKETVSYVNRAEIYVAESQYRLAKSDLQFAINNALASESALINKARAILRMIGG